jgi:predicted Zn-dependent peptidase
MNRLGSEVLAEAPLLSLDEVVARIDGVTIEELAELAGTLWAPERLSVAGIGPDESRFDQAIARVEPPTVEASAA